MVRTLERIATDPKIRRSMEEEEFAALDTAFWQNILKQNEKALTQKEKAFTQKEKALTQKEKALTQKDYIIAQNKKALAQKEKENAELRRLLGLN